MSKKIEIQAKEIFSLVKFDFFLEVEPPNPSEMDLVGMAVKSTIYVLNDEFAECTDLYNERNSFLEPGNHLYLKSLFLVHVTVFMYF